MTSNLQMNDASPESGTFKSVGSALISAALSLPFTGQALAENAPDKGTISVKYLDYLDSQPGEDRIKVKATAVKIIAPVSGEWSLGGSVTTDGISGASPSYHNAGLKKMEDRRNAADVEVTRYFQTSAITLGLNVSNESDYVSKGLSAQASFSSEDRNTTWAAGIGMNRDTINPNNKIVTDEKKRVLDLLFSVTQVLTSKDITQLSVGISHGSGYFSDPYKVFDNRPRERTNRTLLARWNHFIDLTQGTARLSYRYYSDTWSIKAHTIGLEYVQPLINGWTITPQLRIYSQSAANFYVNADTSGSPFPPNPPEDVIYFSEDQRVSAFGARTLGLKVAKQLGDDWLVDIKVEQYTQRSDWRLFGSGSPGMLPFYARSIQLGLSKQF
ncbi:DUF3570 domain-containing protein [Undibacterium sp. RuTC16W]|uniref:DUF3570 domain-containing protein n=1 Tax=Undibacterium sp. RuTC16W TaxID=3413048 RepID=UPI003BF306F8